MTKILFVRHPQTESNVVKKGCGSSNVEGSELGCIQAKNLVKEMQFRKVDIIFSSPLLRAKKLALMIGDAYKVPTLIDELLLERNFGELEMCDVIDKDKEEMSDGKKNSDLHKNVEKIQSMYYLRVKPFIEKIKNEYTNKTVVVIAHSWTGRLFAGYFSNEKKLDTIKETPKNCCIYEYFLEK